ncbi:hypothetical protein AGLY_008086 [Aphis glycines]|uniref:Uncharacterized protein n=1 Tax=Aphis glycines TaxID=307491 RepID=A0A6G0TLP7_APHGL|nr:hypothetical protein AGLY_008086 [Aphis glycines]
MIPIIAFKFKTCITVTYSISKVHSTPTVQQSTCRHFSRIFIQHSDIIEYSIEIKLIRIKNKLKPIKNTSKFILKIKKGLLKNLFKNKEYIQYQQFSLKLLEIMLSLYNIIFTNKLNIIRHIVKQPIWSACILAAISDSHLSPLFNNFSLLYKSSSIYRTCFLTKTAVYAFSHINVITCGTATSISSFFSFNSDSLYKLYNILNGLQKNISTYKN